MIRRRAAIAGLVAFAAILAAGCATRPMPKSTAEITLDALHLEVDPTGELPPRFWDSWTLMQQGKALFEKKRYDEARKAFARVVAEYPESEVVPHALFNVALCHEALGEWDEALAIYVALEKKRGATIELKELRLRQAECAERAELWSEAVAILERLSGMFSLTQIERINATIRHGVALFRADDALRARDRLKTGLAAYEDMTKKQLPVGTYHVARGYFTLGEIYFDFFDRAKLEGEGRDLAERLETKARLLLLARENYLHCLRTYQADWMPASLHRLAHAFEKFYFAMLEYPVPADLDEEEAIAYRRRLDDKIRNVLLKAIDAYERNIKLDRELGLKSPWARKSEKRLAVARRYLKPESE
ncbi:tetratricopeptide repeat protein [bacterium]|nr:tetratricopeptide repeat protein [bacterium]